MALLDSEVSRIRYELGFNLLTTDAVPWISTTQAFEQIIQPYLSAGATTTSATAVTAASTPTPVTITLASGTGFDTGCRVVIDVDGRQEVVTAQLVSGTSLTVMLSKTHSGTYGVTVEGGETIVREILTKIRNVADKLESAATKAGIKRVDEIEFFGTGQTELFRNLNGQRDYWRNELSSVLGIPSMWAGRRGGAQRLSVY